MIDDMEWEKASNIFETFTLGVMLSWLMACWLLLWFSRVCRWYCQASMIKPRSHYPISVSISVSVSKQKSFSNKIRSSVQTTVHQLPYQSPIQCHQIPIWSSSISPTTVKNWHGHPVPSDSCIVAIQKFTLWCLTRRLWTYNEDRNWQEFWFNVNGVTDMETEADTETNFEADTVRMFL